MHTQTCTSQVVELFLRTSMISRDQLVGALRIPFDQSPTQWRDIPLPKPGTGRLKVSLSPAYDEGLPAVTLLRIGAAIEARRQGPHVHMHTNTNTNADL